MTVCPSSKTQSGPHNPLISRTIRMRSPTTNRFLKVYVYRRVGGLPSFSEEEITFISLKLWDVHRRWTYRGHWGTLLNGWGLRPSQAVVALNNLIEFTTEGMVYLFTLSTVCYSVNPSGSTFVGAIVPRWWEILDVRKLVVKNKIFPSTCFASAIKDHIWLNRPLNTFVGTAGVWICGIMETTWLYSSKSIAIDNSTNHIWNTMKFFRSLQWCMWISRENLNMLTSLLFSAVILLVSSIDLDRI